MRSSNEIHRSKKMVSYDYFLDKAGDPYMGKQMENNRVKHSFFQRLLRTQRLSLLPSRSEFIFCFKVPAVVSYLPVPEQKKLLSDYIL